jgi:hypothetical protein
MIGGEMAFTRRDGQTGHADRDAGFEAAVGLDTERPRDEHAGGRTCPHCGAVSRLDMVDMPRMRAYLTCPRCGNDWNTDRMQVQRRPSRARRSE